MPEDDKGIDDRLVDALQQATAILNGVALRALEGADITLHQYRLLTVLDAMGDSLTGRVAMMLKVDASTVTRFGDRLARSGHIERKVDPSHRGRVLLCLTDKGREAVRAVRARRRAELHKILQALPVPQREACATALKAFVVAAGDGFSSLVIRFP